MHSLTPELRTALKRPLFALLGGLWLRENVGTPRAPVDLLGELGRRAGSAGADEPRLRALAVRAITRDLAPVADAEIGSARRVDALLLTGLVVRRPGGIVFALPALAQWFAAQSILEGETHPEALLDAPEDLELWRYPLALAVSLGSWEQAQACLASLLNQAPGFAFRVLDVAFGQAVMSGSPAPPWREGGAQVREALQSLIDATGAGAPLVTDVDADGRLVPMAVASDEQRLSVAFWHGEEYRPDVFAWPPDLHMFRTGWDWGSRCMAPVGPGATWAWRWARDDFKDDLVRRIKSRALPIAPEGPLADEAVWSYACARFNRSVLTCESLPVGPLVKHLDEILHTCDNTGGVMLHVAGHDDHDARGIRAYLQRRVDRGVDQLVAPLPVADRRPLGGRIDEFYSEARLLEVATAMYGGVLVAYRQLVDRWFARLADQLEHRVLMPLRIVAELYPGDPDSYGLIPSLAGWLEALPKGADNEVLVSLAHDTYDFERGRGSWEQQRRARPHAARWLTGTHGGMSFEVGQRTPVADAVYRWLARDLQRLGLAGSLDGNASKATTVWDAPPAAEE